jgi:hypothetical protein
MTSDTYTFAGDFVTFNGLAPILDSVVKGIQ